jgi:hypothetical protein
MYAWRALRGALRGVWDGGAMIASLAAIARKYGMTLAQARDYARRHDVPGVPAELGAYRCRAYFRGRGVMILRPARRCEQSIGHAGRHVCARNGLGAPFTFTWGRA